MLRNRGGKWHYRFQIDGHTYASSTRLEATKRNRAAAEAMEAEAKKQVRSGQDPTQRIKSKPFSSAASEFLDWAHVEYREHPNTARRLEISFVTLGARFADTPVSRITADAIESYKTWRLRDHQVKPVTVRHDLHALSSFFQVCHQA